jgi:CRP/FNR family transcriptional regulator
MIPVQRLAALPSFRDFPPEVLEALAGSAIVMSFLPDEVIFLAGSEPRGWWVLLEGRVRVVRGGVGGRQHVVHTETAGGTLGEVPLFGGGTHPATGIAREPTVCALFSRPALEGAIARCPAVAFLLLQRLAHRVRRLVDRLDERSARSVQARLGEFLLERHAAADSPIVSTGMTQQELAEELGTVREVVSREMRGLIRAGLIVSKGNRRYEIRSMEKLRQLIRQ